MKIAAHIAISFHVYHIGFLWNHLYLRVAMLKTISWQNLKKKHFSKHLRVIELHWRSENLKIDRLIGNRFHWGPLSQPWKPLNETVSREVRTTQKRIVDFREVRTNIHLKWRSKQSDILYEISVLRGPHYTQTMTSKWSWFSMSFAIHCQWRSQR